MTKLKIIGFETQYHLPSAIYSEMVRYCSMTELAPLLDEDEDLVFLLQLLLEQTSRGRL